MIRTRLLVGAAALASTLFLAACGDGPDEPAPTSAPVITATRPAGSTAAATNTAIGATPRPTRAAGDYGPEPLLGGNVTKITPAWGTTVTQAATRTIDPGRPAGLCAEVSFAGLPENVLWFRMAINGVEVTQELTWVAPSQEAQEAKMCYATAEGLPTGRIQAAIVVQNPNNISEPNRQVVAWEFDVK